MKTLQKLISATLISSLLAITMTGCSDDPTVGYTGKNMYRAGIKTVAIPIPTRSKDVYRRENEMKLAEALVKRVELSTPYKVTTKDRADTTLFVTIEKISQQVLSFNPDTGNPRDRSITFIVSFRWVDNRTGKVLVKRSSYPVTDTYYDFTPVSENYHIGAEGVINKLSRRIVEHMETDW